MARTITLSVFIFAASAIAASAADLPAQSRLGAIFAEPAVVRVEIDRRREFWAPLIPYNLLPSPIWARGGYYYGSPWSYYNGGPYYGGPYSPSFIRLPYVCALYGYC